MFNKYGKVQVFSALLVGALQFGCSSPTPSTQVVTEVESPVKTTSMTNRAADSGQKMCFDTQAEIQCPESGDFYGQDAQFSGNQPNYIVYENGTVSDSVTGLMWSQSPDTNGDGKISRVDKLSSAKAVDYCANLDLAGYTDWQLPDIKQAYSLINFQGMDPDPMARSTSALTPFVDTSAFEFEYGNPKERERVIDSQYATTSKYENDEGRSLLFGVNLADGRIKGYDEDFFGRDKTYFVQCVRGNVAYGTPNYVDNGNNTISDTQSGLMWTKQDSGAAFESGINYQTAFDWQQTSADDFDPLVAGTVKNGAMNWVEALQYVQQMNNAKYLGFSDWRLPSIKELETITDYSYSPLKTESPAIDPIFDMTEIVNENGDVDWAFYWSNTTHKGMYGGKIHGTRASYVAFGRSMGYSKRLGKWVDVHGAGSQRSDPKIWDGVDYSKGQGPQLDAVRVYNYVRLVRDDI